MKSIHFFISASSLFGASPVIAKNATTSASPTDLDHNKNKLAAPVIRLQPYAIPSPVLRGKDVIDDAINNDEVVERQLQDDDGFETKSLFTGFGVGVCSTIMILYLLRLCCAQKKPAAVIYNAVPSLPACGSIIGRKADSNTAYPFKVSDMRTTVDIKEVKTGDLLPRIVTGYKIAIVVDELCRAWDTSKSEPSALLPTPDPIILQNFSLACSALDTSRLLFTEHDNDPSHTMQLFKMIHRTLAYFEIVDYYLNTLPTDKSVSDAATHDFFKSVVALIKHHLDPVVSVNPSQVSPPVRYSFEKRQDAISAFETLSSRLLAQCQSINNILQAYRLNYSSEFKVDIIAKSFSKIHALLLKKYKNGDADDKDRKTVAYLDYLQDRMNHARNMYFVFTHLMTYFMAQDPKSQVLKNIKEIARSMEPYLNVEDYLEKARLLDTNSSTTRVSSSSFVSVASEHDALLKN